MYPRIFRQLIIVSCMGFSFTIYFLISNVDYCTERTSLSSRSTWASRRSGTSNNTSSSSSINGTKYAVPNIVHYIWFGENQTFLLYHMLSFVSVSRFQKPDVIWVHGNAEPVGYLWRHVNAIVPNIRRRWLEPKTQIFGKNLTWIEHKSDIARIETVLEFGGIYLDTDVFVLKSLDPLRVYNCTLGKELPSDPNLASGIILAAPGAEFVRLWHEGYREYHGELWLHNSGIVPYQLSQKYPELIHVKKTTLLERPPLPWETILKDVSDWSRHYALHIWHRGVKVPGNPEDIKMANSTFGHLARYVYFGKPDLIPNIP